MLLVFMDRPFGAQRCGLGPTGVSHLVGQSMKAITGAVNSLSETRQGGGEIEQDTVGCMRICNFDVLNIDFKSINLDSTIIAQAAKETGALQAAKTKLEKQVEELTWQLQQEKRMRVDIEEANAKENAKLQSSLQEMQLQFQETKELLIKDHEAAKKDVEPIHVIKEVPVMDQEMIINLTAENEKLKVLIKEHEAAKKDVESIHVIKEVPVLYQEMINNLTAENEKLKVLIKEHEAAKKDVESIHVIKEVPVMDQEMINNLTAENEKLKALVSSLEKKIDETENKYEETNKLNEERLKQALEAETKIIQLKTDMQRLEEKLSDMEAMDQILRHQALKNSPATKMSDHLDSERTQPVENGYHENVDSLIKCVRQDLGFSHGKPIAAFTIYKCLLHWRSFEAERTSVFDRLIQMIGSAIENQDRDDYLVYWLSNTSMLLFLLQRTLKATSATPGKPPAPTSFFGRMTQGFRSSPSSANLSFRGLEVHQVEAKYPALLFKQQLTAYVEKIYGIVRDNMKKELSPLLSSCIQLPPLEHRHPEVVIISTSDMLVKNAWGDRHQKLQEEMLCDLLGGPSAIVLRPVTGRALFRA
ncbi:hypothetical protein RHMOL_Rhmol05G0135000 [Rhododendron molle]|uniref:Uncharacterized protein n=1 Tax=Rhododendron molle TaxID=49168 RepID=A0ACC0NPN5_RHOML|nr:hypothetical protein RHMOL_Rhmol05G0135000 [Rhododendron molle]